jgi:hypothetical protein
MAWKVTTNGKTFTIDEKDLALPREGTYKTVTQEEILEIASKKGFQYTYTFGNDPGDENP